MNVYFDADCGICTKIKNICEVLRRKNSKMVFLDMNISSYKNEIQESIVVEKDGETFRYGASLQKIFSELIFPFNLFKFVPVLILTPLYIFLRFLRKKFSKNICKI
jgi:hypothetical protein